jgi:hypothetical protein
VAAAEELMPEEEQEEAARFELFTQEQQDNSQAQIQEIYK